MTRGHSREARLPRPGRRVHGDAHHRGNRRAGHSRAGQAAAGCWADRHRSGRTNGARRQPDARGHRLGAQLRQRDGNPADERNGNLICRREGHMALGPPIGACAAHQPRAIRGGGRTPMCCLKSAKWKNRLLPECGHAAADASGRDRTQRRNTPRVSRRQGLAWPAAAAKYPSCVRIACGLESQACGDVHHQRRGGWPVAPSGQSSTAAGGETTTPGCRNSSRRRHSENWRSAHTNTTNCNRLTSNAIR